MSVPPPGWSAFCMCILLHICYMLNVPKCQGQQGREKRLSSIHTYKELLLCMYNSLHVSFSNSPPTEFEYPMYLYPNSHGRAKGAAPLIHVGSGWSINND